MAWITPKTDWTIYDYINKDDINRIINNLEFLHEKSARYFEGVADITPMTHKTSYSDMFYSDEMNDIENNLDAVNLLSALDIGVKTLYEGNSNGPDCNELNRIESAELAIYNWLNIHPERCFTWNFGALGGIH